MGFYEGGKLIHAARVRAGLVPVSRRELYELLKPLIVKTCPFRMRHPVDGDKPLVLMFKNPLDWGLLHRTIVVTSTAGKATAGEIDVDQDERRWRLRPDSAWSPGLYHLRVESGLEDVCGNSLLGPFDRPIRNHPDMEPEPGGACLTFELSAPPGHD